MPVDGFANASSTQAVGAIKLDVGGKHMYGVVAISDWDEKVKDIAFIFLISLWALHLLVPVSKLLVAVCLPVLIGFFQVSCICLTLCQSLSSLAEYFQLLAIVTADLLVLLSNSCQALGDVEEFLTTRSTVALKSSAHGPGRELQLTEFIGGCHNLLGNCKVVLSVDHQDVGLQLDGEGLSDVHVNSEARGSGGGDVC